MEVQYTKKALKKMCPDQQCLRSFGNEIGNWEDYLENGSLSWTKVDRIEIIEAEDYHGNIIYH